MCYQEAEQQRARSESDFSDQPPPQSPVILAADEREIVKVTRLDTADYTAMQSQKKRLSDGQVEPVSSPDSELSSDIDSICIC